MSESDFELGPWTVVVKYTLHVEDCTSEQAKRAAWSFINGHPMKQDEGMPPVIFISKLSDVTHAENSPFDTEEYVSDRDG